MELSLVEKEDKVPSLLKATIAKLVQIILQKRVKFDISQASHCSNEWLNDCRPHIKEFHVALLEQLANRTQNVKRLLEKYTIAWKLDFDEGSVELEKSLPESLLCINSISLLRELESFMNTTPPHLLILEMHNNPINYLDYDISYEVSAHQKEGKEYAPLKIHLNSYQFPAVRTKKGELQVEIEFRKNCKLPAKRRQGAFTRRSEDKKNAAEKEEEAVVVVVKEECAPKHGHPEKLEPEQKCVDHAVKASNILKDSVMLSNSPQIEFIECCINAPKIQMRYQEDIELILRNVEEYFNETMKPILNY